MGKKTKKKTKSESSTKYIVDVPNYDSKGNDVSGDHPKGGGRRRKDGTLETSTYNYVPLDDYKDQIRKEVKEEVSREQREKDAEDTGRYSGENRGYDVVEIINSIALILDSIARIVEEHPELVVAAGRFFKKVKIRTQNTVYRAKTAIQKRSRKKLEPESIEVVLVKDNNQAAIKTFEPNKEGEYISVEEARRVFLRMLENYIQFRKDFDCLKNAQLIENDQIQLEDILYKMELFIQERPELMDEKTHNKTLKMIDYVQDEQERRKMMEILHVNVK